MYKAPQNDDVRLLVIMDHYGVYHDEVRRKFSMGNLPATNHSLWGFSKGREQNCPQLRALEGINSPVSFPIMCVFDMHAEVECRCAYSSHHSNSRSPVFVLLWYSIIHLHYSIFHGWINESLFSGNVIVYYNTHKWCFAASWICAYHCINEAVSVSHDGYTFWSEYYKHTQIYIWKLIIFWKVAM